LVTRICSPPTSSPFYQFHLPSRLFIRPPSTSTLLPYTTLFRSWQPTNLFLIQYYKNQTTYGTTRVSSIINYSYLVADITPNPDYRIRTFPSGQRPDGYSFPG